MSRTGLVKCVVWDLDNTVWAGVLLEDDVVTLRPGVRDTIEELDRRGILQSIASRNDAERARTQLRRFGLAEYFLVPQISWGTKSGSVGRIAEELSIGLDTVLVIDDDPFERAEITSVHPQVRVADADDIAVLSHREDLTPAAITAEASQRRAMYLADARRRHAEEHFSGPATDFLASLGMNVVIRPARHEDLNRAEELTVRTNQLNATGYPYSRQELDTFIGSAGHDLIVVELSDTFGSYGIIGLALIEREPDTWMLKLLLMSCRVASRGIGAVLLNQLIARAAEHNVRLRGEFVPTGVNRAMHITYRFAGFREIATQNGRTIMEYSGSAPPPAPEHLIVAWSDR